MKIVLNNFKKNILISCFFVLSIGFSLNSYGDTQPAEIRLGGMYHNRRGFISAKEIPEIAIQYLFASLGEKDSVYTNPRPMIGSTISLNGGTSQYYAGLTWHIPFNNFFLELNLGGEFHNGPLKKIPNDQRRALGSRFLFRESAALGINFMERLTLSIVLDHSSNANLASKNDGLSGIGMQIGYKF